MFTLKLEAKFDIPSELLTCDFCGGLVDDLDQLREVESGFWCCGECREWLQKRGIRPLTGQIKL